MIIVVDLDDTIADTDNYSEKYIAQFIKDNNLPYKQVKKVCRFAEEKFDWTLDEALLWYKTHGDKMMREFPCREFSVETLNKLHDEGHQIVIATARATDWHSNPVEATDEWLKKVGLKFNKIYIGRKDKENICNEEKADFFIDDDVKICSRVADNCRKTKSLLISTDYNKTLSLTSGVERIEDLRGLEKLIQNEKSLGE